MPKLPRIPSFLVLRVLLRAGFYVYHQTGSHAQLRSVYKPRLRLTVPVGKRDLAPKTLKTIIKQADLSIDQFLKLL